MRLILRFTLLLNLLLFSTIIITAQDETGDYTLEHNDLDRTYYLYVPSNYDPDTDPMPLIVMLHGRTQTGRRTAESTEFDRFARDNGFIVVYPDGIANQWNYLKDVPFFALDGPDDTAFILALIDELSEHLNIDAERIYGGGLSNGGFMAQRLACEVPESFSAIASVMAPGFGGMLQICDGQAPIPFMLIHGTADPIVSWDGDSISDGEREILLTASAPDTLGFWAGHNGCSEDFEREDIPKRDESSNMQTTVFTIPNCENNSEVVFYAVFGGGHTWPGVRWEGMESIVGPVTMDFHASEVIWDFFSRHTRDVP